MTIAIRTCRRSSPRRICAANSSTRCSKLLGWDVLNRQGHAEAFKEVVHEDSLKIGGHTKSPDYSFRIGAMRIFFVEVKGPSVKLNQVHRPRISAALLRLVCQAAAEPPYGFRGVRRL